ncbi:DUF3977 family protein [Paenibacillus alvei]|uniref:DUF3977 family protein n=1 Tax=Paenibacillus alvei TaxID=44250 RepID=UPI0010FD14BD
MHVNRSSYYFLKTCYIRVWLGKKVLIWDSKEGLKRMKKSRNAAKIIFGISS